MMFRLLSPRMTYLVAILGALVALIAFVVWMRWDAVEDERARNKLDAVNGRVEALTETKERRNDVEILSDDDLRNRLLGRVPGGDRPSGPF